MDCECDEYAMCGEHTAELEDSILHQRSLSQPESGSIEDVMKFVLRNMETPFERFMRRLRLHEKLRSGAKIQSRGFRIPIYIPSKEGVNK